MSNEYEYEREPYQNEWESIRTRRRNAFAPSSHKPEPIPNDAVTDVGENSGTVDDASSNGPPDPKDDPTPVGQRPQNLVGLSLSGGGLRSALFNDGLLQAFSHRGLLRYVDYLSSVSGGAYIAGHLMSYSSTIDERSDANHEPCDFHNDSRDVDSDTKPVWHLGRDPDGGQEDHDRLPAIGSYLNRSFQFFAGYCLRQLPVVLLYLSFFGLLATLLAIFYRSYDAPIFRTVYFRLLDVKYLDELLIAFIPPLITASVTLCLALVAWIPIPNAWIRPQHWETRFNVLQKRLRFLAKFAFWVSVFLALISVAVYLGNDLTKASSNRNVTNHNRLNQFALQITIAAAATQLLVFFGRDRLFRSESSEAAPWKKVAQYVLTRGTVFLALSALIHGMARENISDYTSTRDPYLVRGDVGDWHTLDSLFNEYERRHSNASSGFSKSIATSGRAGATSDRYCLDQTAYLLDPRLYAARYLSGESSARRNWAFSWAPQEFARPSSPAEERDRNACVTTRCGYTSACNSRSHEASEVMA